MTGSLEVKTAAQIAAAATAPWELPPGLASRILLELGDKPVIRELHDPTAVGAAADYWRAAGLATAVGPPVDEHLETAAKTRGADRFTVRPLQTHPVIAQAVRLGGAPARRVLLDARSPVYRWLADRLGADQVPARSGGGTRRRQALYVSRDAALVDRARSLDAMGGGREDPVAMGKLLGYPECCVAAFAALDVRYPNRVPIAAAARRTNRFEPLLNNASLDRFVFVPHFVCRFDCPRSLAQAQRVADVLGHANPGLLDAVLRVSSLPRLVHSDPHQAVLTGATRRGDRLMYVHLKPLEELWPSRSPADPFRWGRVAPARDGVLRVSPSWTSDASVGPLVLPFGL